MQSATTMLNDGFYGGYVFGVELYQSYPTADYELRMLIRDIIDNVKILAQRGDWYFKGIMTGYHDAADDRKARKVI